MARPSARSPSSAATTRATSASSPSAARARCTRPSSPRRSAIREVLIPPHPGHHLRRGPADVRPALRPHAHRLHASRARSTATRSTAASRSSRPTLRRAPGARRRRPRRVRVERFLDCRYVGPGLRAAHPGARGPVRPRRRSRRSTRAHGDEYGHAFDDPIEIVNLRVTVRRAAPAARRGSPSSRARGDPRRDGASRRDLAASTASSPSCPRRTADSRAPAARRAGRRARVIFCSSTPPIAVPPGWAATATPDGPLCSSTARRRDRR